VLAAAVSGLLSVVAPFVPASPRNYSHAHRPASAVRLIVVHETEGSFAATVAWFRNPKARAAANYVVGRDGRIAHMVPDNEIAWHAGNGYVNAHSIGIEHEGLTNVDGTITDAEYRASAQLVATLTRRYRIPVDRGHIIGHDQVPDPFHRGEYGGFAHHTDPGVYWDWPRFLTYVRDYRAGHAPPPRPIDVTIPGLQLGQTVTGLVSWTAAATGEVDHVDFLVDGVVRATVAAAPYTWGWDTALEQNGRHVLTVRAVAPDGRSAISTVVVDSNTPPPAPPTVTLPALPEPLTGNVQITPTLAGGAVDHVELWIDGVLTQTATAAPWTLTWTATPGQHTLAVRAVAPRGRATAAITLVQVPEPPPAPR
jgi:hypothetical protein